MQAAPHAHQHPSEGPAALPATRAQEPLSLHARAELLPATSLVHVDDERAQDVGNVVHLEHLNFEVLDLEDARLFYSEGLGLTLDPGTLGEQRGGPHVHWYNIGRQQFHIVRRTPPAHRLPPGGVVGLVLPNLDQVHTRLLAVQKLLPLVQVQKTEEGALEVVDPNGVTFRIHAAFGRFPFPRGIAYINLPCHAGTGQAIADFYRTTLGAVVHTAPAALPSTSASAGEEDAAAAVVEVVLGSGSSILFHESPALGQRTDEAVRSQDSGWHVCVYVADFSTTYRKVDAAGLVCNNHPYRDKCNSLADALTWRQFRIQDVPLGGCGTELAYRLNHEVRSTHHLRYLRPLYNRHGEGFDAL